VKSTSTRYLGIRPLAYCSTTRRLGTGIDQGATKRRSSRRSVIKQMARTGHRKDIDSHFGGDRAAEMSSLNLPLRRISRHEWSTTKNQVNLSKKS
jgi:hypothetical protein